MSLRPHWTQEDLDRLHAVQTHGEMLDVAMGILSRMPKPAVQVCGPISTGRSGTIEENLLRIARAVDWLVMQGKYVFDQTPFEEPIVRLHYQKQNAAYPVNLLTDFYLPIFKSGLVTEAHFLPGWQESRGATWEHEQLLRLKIPIIYFAEDWDHTEIAIL